MGYKLIFSDIDGTLLNSDHKISSGSLSIIKELNSKGIPFILVSARMPSAILPLQEQLNINEPIISFSGALVLGAADTDGTREILYNKTMDPMNVKSIYDQVTGLFPTISFSAYTKDNWLVSSEDEWIIEEKRITGTSAQLYNFKDNLAPMNKLLCMGPPEEIHILEMELKKQNAQSTIYKSKSTYLEIMAEHVTKSTAIQSLIERYQVSKREIAAFGDNYNDMDMLIFAGLGVAMGNSPDEVKAVADIVTLSNDQDGLEAALKTYCLDL